MKSKILITGGCGKIGSYFVMHASEKYIFRVVDKTGWDNEKHGPLMGESLIVDLQNLEACRKACEEIDIVIHLAADTSGGDSDEQNEVKSARALIAAASEADARRAVAVISSFSGAGPLASKTVRGATQFQPHEVDAL